MTIIKQPEMLDSRYYWCTFCKEYHTDDSLYDMNENHRIMMILEDYDEPEMELYNSLTGMWGMYGEIMRRAVYGFKGITRLINKWGRRFIYFIPDIYWGD